MRYSDIHHILLKKNPEMHLQTVFENAFSDINTLKYINFCWDMTIFSCTLNTHKYINLCWNMTIHVMQSVLGLYNVMGKIRLSISKLYKDKNVNILCDTTVAVFRKNL